MMKKILKTLMIIAICNTLTAQTSGYVEYDYSVMHSIKYTTKSILQFDSDKSVFNTLRKISENDSLTKISSDDVNVESYLINKDSKNKPTYFTNKKDNTLISKVWKFRKNYFLKESIPKIKWEIQPEYKKLSDLSCQKAVGYFRGRTYTVWFTETIPVNYGPWKLQGLPGLILEANDDQNIFFIALQK